MTTDVFLNRAARKWTRVEQCKRLLWTITVPLFRFSPRVFWGWRRTLLRIFGAKIGPDVHIYPSVRITIPWNLKIDAQAAVGDRTILYALGPIHVAARATISQYAHLCAGTHDWRDSAMPLVKAPIVVEEGAWVCADAFVGPGVTVGKGAILAACGVAMKDIEPFSIFGGNPAKKLRDRSK